MRDIYRKQIEMDKSCVEILKCISRSDEWRTLARDWLANVLGLGSVTPATSPAPPRFSFSFGKAAGCNPFSQGQEAFTYNSGFIGRFQDRDRYF